ncbi:hypothetical protein HOD38_00690 [archaeon]|jgi:hypothetical protein|nr:hypothetical protein [archaeon]MBT4396762.1 hypothetical protein [archaeon]MBT4441372.1 hypothetical protein [archaeon]
MLFGDNMFHKDLQDALRYIEEGKGDEALNILNEHRKIEGPESQSNQFIWAKLLGAIKGYELNIDLAIENIQSSTNKRQQRRYIDEALIHFDSFVRNAQELIKILELEEKDLK